MNSLVLNEIVTMETSALERWGKGDPDGFLDISADEVTYFDPFIEKRIDGKPALTEWYNGLRGKIFMDSFRLINPVVQVNADIAILTFNYESTTGSAISKWCCTEVYKKFDSWKIIHTHWTYLGSD